jgi:hypothetical protein
VDSPSVSRVHVAIGIVVILLLPLASWIDGSGQLAWTMFSRTGRYRLVMTADGAPMNPTELAAAAAPGPTSAVLAGADQFKHHDVARATLRRHLDDVLELACTLRRGAIVTLRLEERVRSDDPIRISEVSTRCAR